MGSTQQILIKHLETLKDITSTTLKKCGALTYITSNVGLNALSESSDDHLFECGKAIMEMISSEDGDLSSAAKKSLQILIEKPLKTRELKWFQLSIQMNRKKRLKFFDCLESIETTTLTSITENEETLKFISDCMQSVQATTMSWLSSNACIDNIQPLKQAESKKKSDQFEIEEQLINKAIALLQRLYEYAVSHPEYQPQQFHVLLLDKVATLAYMGLKRQRAPALQLLNTALKSNLVSYVQEKFPNLWTRYKDSLQTVYCARMSLLVKSNEQDWSIQWSNSIQMLGTELHRGAQLINYLLGIEEKAFKSSDTNIRKQAFLCWQLLIDNFALNPVELSSARRVKLLCIPLNAKNSKTETLALTKLEVWWHLIIKLNPTVPMYVNQVLTGFLDFCFGPLGDTPLLSRTVDVIASPGKRFNKTRVFAVDALLQMLVRRREDRRLISSVLKEGLPNPISSSVFKEAYKILFHSLGEAVLIISSLSENDVKNRDKLCTMLWSNLVEYVEEAPKESRIDMFRELILVIGQIASHIDDSPMISDLILNVIAPELAEQSEDLSFDDDTLIDLTKKLLAPSVLKKIEEKQFDGIKMITYQAIKPKPHAGYHTGTLPFIKSVLSSVETNFEKDIHPAVFYLWCLFAEILFKYISEKQNINEGTDSVYNFATVQKMINFPFDHLFWQGPEQVSKVGNLWGKLYIIFIKNADTLPTINSNDMLNSVTKTLEEFCKKEKQCYRLIAHCVGALVSSINYQTLIPSKEIPPLVNLMKDVTLAALSNKQNVEIELSLKALSSFLITIFGLLEPVKTLLCLEVVEPSIKMMLETDVPGNIEKEVFHTWETVVLILKGHAKILSNDLLSSYRASIRSASLHKNKEMSAQTQVLWKLNDLRPEAKSIMSELEIEVQNTLSKSSTTVTSKKKTEKPGKLAKIAGSFLGRAQLGSKTFTTPRILSNNKKEKEGKKLAPLSPEPDSQDYVVITSDVRVDASRLTEHQKESLKRRRDDIPAMYNDLSQSASRDTQDLQEWFNSKTNKIVSLNDSNDNKNQVGANDTTVKLPEQPEEMEVTATCDESKIIVDEQKETKSNLSTVEISPPVEGADVEASASTISDGIVKKLDFESREDFPDENENTQGKETNPKSVPNYGLRKRSSILNKEKDEEESQNRAKRGRPPTPKVQVVRWIKNNEQTDSAEKTVKRKATSDNDLDHSDRKRRRRTANEHNQSNETQSDSESIYSTESENQIPMTQDFLNGEKKLPEQTKRELSRLRIDMVSDSYLPGRRRSKFSEEVSEFFTSKKTSSESRTNRLRTTKPDKEEESQELVKKRTRRVPSKFNLDSSKQEETSPSGNLRQSADPKDPKINSSSEELSDALNSFEKKDSPENSPKNANLAVVNKSDEISDQDEVVESSQDTNAILLRSPKRLMEKKIGKVDSPNRTGERAKIVPETTKNVAELDDTFYDSMKSNSKPEIIQSAKKSPEKWKQSLVPNLPKNISKLKTYRPTRTQTIMSCLLPNKKKEDELVAVVEIKDLQSEKLINDDESTLKKNKIKEFDSGSPKTRKDRPSILLKQPDRIGSPSGSRQEKIFNIMKTVESTPPSSLFSKLRNDGEKISPKMGKAQNDDSNKSDETDSKGTDRTITLGREQLPILEWSSANPPSLSASPSVSILKPRLSILEISENDAAPSKRKRVSFADPPVSREMGYKVLSSPSKNKIGSPRSVLGRKDTPLRIKQSKFREIKMNAEKSQQTSVENTPEGSGIENLTDVDIQCQEELFAQIATELEDAADMNIDSDTDETPEEIPPTEQKSNNTNSPITQTSQKIFGSQALQSVSKPIGTVDTQQDLFSTVQSREKSKTKLADFFDPKYLDDSKNSFRTNISSTPTIEVGTRTISKSILETVQDSIVASSSASPMSDPSKLILTDDFLLGNKVLSEPIVLRKDLQPLSTTLEDTVLIQNISRLNSSAASDEMFNERPIRTSTQTTAMIATAECDTLPITDSMTLSQSMSQESLATQDKTCLSHHRMDQTEPVYRTLLGCEEPISSIVKDLTNPLWVSNLSNYFSSRSIDTIGDLAKSSEHDVSRMPVKGTNKVLWVRTVLDRFAKSYIPKLEAKYGDPISPKISQKLVRRTSTPRQSDHVMEIIEETIEFSTRDNSEINNSTDDLMTSNKSIEPVEHMIQAEKCQDTQPSNAYGSMIIDTSISPPKKTSTGIEDLQIFPRSKPIDDAVNLSMSIRTQSLQVQSAVMKDLMHNLDETIVLQTVVERCSIEQILHHVKEKLKDLSEEEQVEKIVTMLGINKDVDSNFRTSCAEIGLSKVLLRLPEIFSSDENLFTEILRAYRTNITSMDCIKSLDMKVLKEAICKSCSSSDLCEMLSTVLSEEEKKQIVTPLTETSSLKAMLKRMPVDSIISHTIADNDLIPSLSVLEVGLKGNETSVVTNKIMTDFPEITNEIFEKMSKADDFSSRITEGGVSKEKMLDIYQAISSKFSIDELTAAFGEAIKKRLDNK